MFEPKYHLTQSLLKNLSDIERLYGKLEGMKIPENLQLNLERNNLFQSSYASNKIEGNSLEQVEVTNLLLNERVPVNRDEKEVFNYFEILKTLDEKARETLSQELILEIHRELLKGVNDRIRGKFRYSKVVVGKKNAFGFLSIKHNPPTHNIKELRGMINDLCHWVNKSEDLAILKAGIFHHQFVYIHPFEDGNGRVCRILTALLLLKNKYLINKYFVLDDYYDIDRTLYSDKLHTADKGDKTEWLEYFTEGVKYSLESALSKVDVGLGTLAFDVRPTKKESEVLKIVGEVREISSGDLARKLLISRQQAFNLIRSLVKKGYLLKKKQGKASYYVMK